jgi:hypothetical protein
MVYTAAFRKTKSAGGSERQPMSPAMTAIGE